MGAEKERIEAEEIEITPEMIEAGASAVVRAIAPSRLYAPMAEEKLAILVFRAMISAIHFRLDKTARR